MSKTRKKLLSNQAERDKIAAYTKKAWEKGLYDNVNVGRCKWYSIIDHNNIKHKVQGTYELKFAEYLTNNKIDFITHT